MRWTVRAPSRLHHDPIMRASDLARPDHGLRLPPLEFRQPLVLPSFLDRQSFHFLFLSLDTQFLDRRGIADDQLLGCSSLLSVSLCFLAATRMDVARRLRGRASSSARNSSSRRWPRSWPALILSPGATRRLRVHQFGSHREGSRLVFEGTALSRMSVAWGEFRDKPVSSPPSRQTSKGQEGDSDLLRAHLQHSASCRTSGLFVPVGNPRKFDRRRSKPIRIQTRGRRRGAEEGGGEEGEGERRKGGFVRKTERRRKTERHP